MGQSSSKHGHEDSATAAAAGESAQTTNNAGPSNVEQSSRSRQKEKEKEKSRADAITADTPASRYVTVDGGFLIPMSGTYATNPRDWDREVVVQLIRNRRIAPFYRGLQDELEGAEGDDDLFSETPQERDSTGNREKRREIEALLDEVGVKADQESLDDQGRIGMRAKESAAHHAAEVDMYERGTSECPICMMNFPNNMNTSRCCDQPICTECLVQIKRAEPDVTHIDVEPVACPFCVEANFGVFYRPPAPMFRRDPKGRLDIAADNDNKLSRTDSAASQNTPGSPSKRSDLRRKSMSANGKSKSSHSSMADPMTAPEVVSVDLIHPNWQEKVEVVRATAARRANRRIVFRQVGDRVIPVGISSSRDIAALVESQAAAQAMQQSQSGDSPGRRGRRRGQSQTQNTYGTYGTVGQDLEELMMNEAIRLSIIEAEEAAKKKQEEEAKAKQSKAATESPKPVEKSTAEDVAPAEASSSRLQTSTQESPSRAAPRKAPQLPTMEPLIPLKANIAPPQLVHRESSYDNTADGYMPLEDDN